MTHDVEIGKRSRVVIRIVIRVYPFEIRVTDLVVLGIIRPAHWRIFSGELATLGCARGGLVPGRAGPGSGHGLQSARGREVVASYTKSAKLTKCSVEVIIVTRDGRWASVLT